MSIQSVGVVGAGTMGNGIAQACASAGLDVVMIDISSAALERGMASISGSLERLVSKDKLTPAARDAALARLRTATDQAALGAADIVIEAASENLELKLKLLRSIDGVAKADAIIASNTSSISITRLAAAIARPQRLVGMHFFNPVPLMGLVEVIRGLQTSDATHGAVMEQARQLGKTPVSVRNSAGFAVNRVLCPMLNEAIFAYAEGIATAEDIDAAMKLGCNHPIGPLALADMIGLDTLLAIMEVFEREFGDPKYRPAPLLREMVDAGYLGRKSGRGFYSYA